MVASHILAVLKRVRLVEGETVVVGDVASAAAGRRALVALLAAAPPPLPVVSPGAWATPPPVVPPVHDHPALVAPFAVDPLVRRRQREQPLLPCKPVKR